MAEGDFPSPSSFTALLVEGMKGDDFQAQVEAEARAQVEGTLESLVPLSALSRERVRNRLASRKRRQMVSERMECLRMLIPGHGNKLSTADMLEEAYNYVKFMEAQVLVLRSMPAPAPAPAGGLLRTLLNSPEAQAALASNKYCLVPAGAGPTTRWRRYVPMDVLFLCRFEQSYIEFVGIKKLWQCSPPCQVAYME